MPAARPARLTTLLGTLLALALLPTPHTAHAQAPTWAGAATGSATQLAPGTSQTRATAVDPATGNVYSTGFFSGTVVFGSTSLVSVGNSDIFVAKWDAATGAYTSAVRGGGTSADQGLGIAVSSAGGTTSVYVTGSYNFTSTANVNIAGTPLSGSGSGLGNTDIFVAKYTDPGTGLTTTNGGAVRGGGFNNDRGTAVAVSSAGGTTSVYVTGTFTGAANASIAGRALAGSGDNPDLFVAKYTDAGTGLTNVDAVSGGATGSEAGQGIALSSAGGTTSIYVVGVFSSGRSAVIAGTTLAGTGPGSGTVNDLFVAKYIDAGTTLTGSGALSGGGTGSDQANAVAVSSAGGTTSVYVAGTFDSNSTTPISIAGKTLTGAGGQDLFVARYTDPGTGLQPAGEAVSGGGPAADQANAVAVSSAGGTTSVYVAGVFNASSSTSASIGGTSLTGSGPTANTDVYVARYTDAGTGPLQASGAVSGGGAATDQGYSLALGGSSLYLGAAVGDAVASFGSSPARLVLPNTAVLGQLSPEPLAWQGLATLGQGGFSFITGTAVDPLTGNVYSTGYFSGVVTFGNTRLISEGGNDLFVAKWDATAGAYTSAVRGGGTNSDQGNGVALVRAGGTVSVYVTGAFTGNSSASIAGTPLAGTGANTDVFVAKYTDAGTGLTNGGAVSGGGTSTDQGLGIALSSSTGTTSVYVTGSFSTAAGGATIAGTLLTGVGSQDVFVAKYTDPGTGLATTDGGAVSGGGTSLDQGTAIAVRAVGSTTNVYVTGSFITVASGATIAGTLLAGAGGQDLFVAKYTDPGTGLTTTNGGAVSGGDTGTDQGQGIAVRGTGSTTSVYVAGYFTTATGGATIAGTLLAGAGNQDVFVAKYTDPGTGLTTTDGGAVSGGGTGNDQGLAIAVRGTTAGLTTVYVTGSFTTAVGGATIAGTLLTGAGNQDLFVARYTDPGTGLTATNGGAVSGGGAGFDQGTGVVIVGQRVFVGGSTVPGSSFGATMFNNPVGASINLLGQITDTSLPLPVELTQFTAAPAGPTAVRLAWATASEKNSAAFEVERSADGREFTAIGTVAAAGSSSAAWSYELTDARLPGAARLYYRLKQVDLDGTFSYSPVRTVAFSNSPIHSLTVFPNPTGHGPAHGAATLTGTQPGTAVAVYDALGRPVATATADAAGNAALALPAGIPAGVYVVRAGNKAVRLAVE